MRECFCRLVWLKMFLFFSFFIQNSFAGHNISKILPIFVPKGFEARLVFDQSVEFEFYDLDPEKNPKSKEIRENMAREEIEKQLEFLSGTLSAQQEEGREAAPKGDHQVQITSYSLKKPNIWSANYHYDGTILLKDRPEFENTITLTLPINPRKIWQATGGIVKKYNPETKKDEPFNPCMDFCVPEDFGNYYFHYFWKPELPGCPLKELSKVKPGETADYVKFRAKFTRLETKEEREKNTLHPRYPRYPELVREGVVEAVIFVGMDDENNSWETIVKEKSKKNDNKQYVQQDDGGLSFEEYKRELQDSKKLDFTLEKKWSSEDIQTYYESKGHTWREEDFIGYKKDENGKKQIIKLLPTIIDYKKIFKNITMKVRLVFTPTGHNDRRSFLFRLLYVDAKNKSSVIIYDGHSGQGVNLDPWFLSNNLEDNFDENEENQYQIFRLDSCHAYTYYSTPYIHLKKGRRYTEVLTNGLITDMDVPVGKKVALITAITDWLSGNRAWSYEDIGEAIDTNNLSAVIGDEDNPTDAPPFPK